MEVSQMDGVLPLRKPKGMTSHDCVNQIRKLFSTKKVGHTGTLDPDVEGVLPICIGRATKIVEYLTNYPKTYEGIIKLGTSTTTEDASGEIVDEMKVSHKFTREHIERIFHEFEGEIKQVPPMYSAVKIKGKKLYEYAREGKHIDRPARSITIYRLEIISNQDEFTDEIPFRVKASKGTYVRTLAVDIGRGLGYPAHLSYLIRTASGPFNLDQCFSFEELIELDKVGQLSKVLLPIPKALESFPSLMVSPEIEKKIQNGAVLKEMDPFYSGLFTVYNRQGECLAIYQPHPEKQGWIKPVKILKMI